MRLVQRTSLYRHYDADGRLLYVGISVSHLLRMVGHRKASDWYWDIKRVEVEHFPCHASAAMAEITAIRTEQPLWNKAHQPEPFRIIRLEPGGDPSELIAAFKSAQNVAHVRKARAKTRALALARKT
jgi:hypothetical protein